MDAAFAKFAEGVVLFCHVTSHVEGDKDPELLNEKGGGGFPYLVFMDADGNVITEHEDARTPAAFTATRDDVTGYLKAKADKTAVVELALYEMSLGKATREEGEAKLKGQKLTPEQEKRRAAIVYNLEVIEATNGYTNGKKFYEDFKAGKKPSKDAAIQPYYQAIMSFGEIAKKADAFEAGLTGVKEYFENAGMGSNPQVVRWIQSREAVLKKLQGK